jgi:cytochrome c-type biogenesis protein CcmH/NrfG
VRTKVVVGVLVLAFAFYAVTIGWRGVLLMADGRPAAVALGLGVVLLPALAAYAVWREIGFGLGAQRLADELAARGALPVDDLPRRRSGRVDRDAADAAFERFRRDTQTAPDDWAAWFRLGTAYDAAGDRRRARAAVRHALALHAAGTGVAGPTQSTEQAAR